MVTQARHNIKLKGMPICPEELRKKYRSKYQQNHFHVP
jgi:hypothetical protein